MRFRRERQQASDTGAGKARDLADALNEASATLRRSTRSSLVPDPNKTLVEQYRHLAAALHHAQLKTGAHTVMVASAVQARARRPPRPTLP